MTTIGTLYDQLAKANPKHGRLKYVSTTALSFLPYGGDALKLNGRIRVIPSTGIVGLANTSVFVDGVAGQNLIANSRYLVYVFDNGGVLTADFRSGASHMPSTTTGNIGVEVYSANGTTPDDTRSVIGMVRANASAQFVDSQSQRFVINWFNRRTLPMQGVVTPGIVTTSTSFIELSSPSRVEFLTWAIADECVQLIISGQATAANVASYARSAIGFDGVILAPAQIDMVYIDRFASYSKVSASNIIAHTFAEGYHYVTPIGRVNAGVTGTFNIFISGTVRG